MVSTDRDPLRLRKEHDYWEGQRLWIILEARARSIEYLHLPKSPECREDQRHWVTLGARAK
jgi:hypothetical protein